MSLRLQQLFILIFLTGMLFSFTNTHAESLQTTHNNQLPFSNIVVLGDSLSDNGNLFNGNTAWWVPVPRNFMPKPPYFDGRFSNGPVWSDLIAENFQKQAIKTVNYAVGGSLINKHFGLYMPYTLGNQIDRYFQIENPTQSEVSESLFVIWIGGNDYLQGVQYFSDPEADTNYAIETLKQNIQGLMDAKARKFLIINLPDLSQTPYSQTQDKQITLHQLTTLHNQKLATLIAELRRNYSDVNIQLYDMSSMFEALTTDPNQFNNTFKTDLQITNTKSSCWSGGYRITRHLTNDEEANIQNNLDQFLRSQHPINTLYSNGFVDTKAMAHDINASPSLHAAYAVSYTAGTICAEPDHYIFWDQVHPTKVVHQAIAKVMIDAVNEHWQVDK